MESLLVICLGLGLLLVSHVVAVWRWSRTFSISHDHLTHSPLAPASDDQVTQDVLLSDVLNAGQQLMDAMEQQHATATPPDQSTELNLAEARDLTAVAAGEYARAMSRLRSATQTIKFVPKRGTASLRASNYLTS